MEMTNAQIIMKESIKLMNEGKLKGTGREITVILPNMPPIKPETETAPVTEVITEKETTEAVTEAETEVATVENAPETAAPVETEQIYQQEAETVTTAFKTSDGYIGAFVITGYCEKCNGGFDDLTSIGTKLIAGVTVAMNRDQMKELGLKYGDHIYIDGLGERIIQDCGCEYGKIDVVCPADQHPAAEEAITRLDGDVDVWKC